MSFSDPIEQGGALIIDSLHSPNFQTGVSGWSINKDGTSEFQGATLRGSLQIGTGPNSTIVLSSSGGQPFIEFTDSHGKKWDIFTTNDVTHPGVQLIPVSAGAARMLSYFSDGIAFEGGFTPRQIVFEDSAGNGGGFFRVYDSPGTPVAHGFDTVTNFFNGWTVWGAPFVNARGLILPDGMAHVEGVLRPGTTGVGVLVFNLPARFQPQAGTVRISCAEGPGVGGNGSAWLDVTKNSGAGTADFTLTSGAVGSLSFCAQYSVM